MRDRHTREVLFLDLVLSVTPDNVGGVQSLRWFMSRIYKLFYENKTSRWGRDKIRKVRICKMSEVSDEAQSVTLLLHLNDREGPDAAFCDMTTDKQREEHKGDTEGRPETVHVLFKLHSDAPDGNRYSVMLEVGSKLNRASVERYFNWLLKEVKREEPKAFEYPNPDGSQDKGKPRMVKVMPRAVLEGHLSEEFQEEIASGKLSGISLISREVKHLGTGETPLVKPVVSEIKLAPAQQSWREAPMAAVRDALRIGKKAEYASAKISFQSEDGVGHSCEIDTDTGNVRGDGFIKKKRIRRTDIIFKEAEESIHDVIEFSMKTWLNIEAEQPAARGDDVVVPTAAAD